MMMAVLRTGLLGIMTMGLCVGTLSAGTAPPEAAKTARPDASKPAHPKAESRHPMAVSDIPPPEQSDERAKERRERARARHPIILSDIPPPVAGCERAQDPKAEAACRSAHRQGAEPEKPPR